MPDALPPGIHGLSADQAAARLASRGPNELTQAKRIGWVRQLVHSLASPLTLILLAASAVAAFTGRVVDASIIIGTVLLGAVLDAVQVARSSQAMESLRHRVIATATVARDEHWVELPRRDVVPGDVVRLTSGDMVPADALLIHARGLHVQQAALTGESLAVEKDVNPSRVAEESLHLTNPAEQNAVFLGTSIVSGIGIARVMATGRNTAFGEIAERMAEAPPPTPLEHGLRRFSSLLAQTVVFLVLFLVLVSVVLHRDPLQSLLFAVALAVGIVPEFMPMVTSITLAAGAVRMARQRVIVKHLAAIHSFGSIDILCSDKTGTLTRGDMRLVSATDVLGANQQRVLELGSVTAHLQTGLANPFDAALRDACACPAGWSAVDEIPLDLERRRMSVVVAHEGRVMMIVKGAPEHVLDACSATRADGTTRPLDDATRRAAADFVRQAGDEGRRVLAIATRELPRQDAYSAADEHALILEGWLTFEDPPLPDAAATIARLAADGVQLKILSGDDLAVARRVCASTGVDATAAITGPELDKISDAALGTIAERTTLFARVTPQQKHRIILALEARDHVVGYLGDGINDAPSLHAADVGISVAGAVDIARDAADVVLLERRLDVLHLGILEGRKAFGNLMKYVLMGTSSNFGNMFSMAVASLIVPFLPMLPTQILLNNFLYDLSQIAIPTDRVDDAYIRTPHRWDLSLVKRFMVRIGLVSSFFDMVTFAALLWWFRATPAEFRTGWFMESLLTQTLVLLVIRTTGNPLRSRPSAALAASVGVVAAAGLLLPYIPIARVLEFTPPPPTFLLFLGVTTLLYLVAAEFTKRSGYRSPATARTSTPR